MNTIVHVMPYKHPKPGGSSDPHSKKQAPIIYRKDSIVQLAQNDTRRYVQGDMITYNKKVDEYFASTRKFILEKYHIIKKQKKFVYKNKKLTLLGNNTHLE